MEGGADYFLSGNHISQLMWLQDVLQRIGDTLSAQIITELRSMNESQRLEMKPLCDRYYGHRHHRWQLLKRTLKTTESRLMRAYNQSPTALDDVP
jgi:hypothetical protein